MRATLTPSVALFTRPTYSAISLGSFPAACTIVGASMSFAMRESLRRDRDAPIAVTRVRPHA